MSNNSIRALVRASARNIKAVRWDQLIELSNSYPSSYLQIIYSPARPRDSGSGGLRGP